jgi:hypothetical protein
MPLYISRALQSLKRFALPSPDNCLIRDSSPAISDPKDTPVEIYLEIENSAYLQPPCREAPRLNKKLGDSATPLWRGASLEQKTRRICTP